MRRPVSGRLPLPSSTVLLWLQEELFRERFPGDVKAGPEYQAAWTKVQASRAWFTQAGHDAFALLFAATGAILGTLLEPTPRPSRVESVHESPGLRTIR